MLSVEATGEHAWTVTHRPVPLRPPIVLSLQQLSAVPSTLLVLREEDDVSVFDVTYELEPDRDGTRFTQTSVVKWKTLPPLLHAAFERGVRRDVERQLGDLKRVLEA